MLSLITGIHVFLCVLLILIVLLQAGKGAEVSASLSGSSQTIFGASGGANFFTKLTAVLAALFMITSVSITILKNKDRESVFDSSTESIPLKDLEKEDTKGPIKTEKTDKKD